MINKRGSILIYGMCLGLCIVILTLALAPVVQDFTDEAMDSSHLDCSNSSISNFAKAGCVAVDLGGFYFVGTLLLIGGGVISYKLLF